MNFVLRTLVICAVIPHGLFAPPASVAALPPDAQALLDQFPDRKLPLEYALKRAVDSADAFRAVRASRGSAEAPSLIAWIPLETRLLASTGLEWNRFRPTTPFGTQRQDSSQLTLGVSKGIGTGTQVSLELAQNALNIDFGAAFGTTVAMQSAVTLSVTQSLLKNAFGDSWRAGLRAGNYSKQALELEVAQQLDDLTASIATAFYQAWAQQEQVRNSKDALVRQERLLRVVSARRRRGVAEEPDLISAKVAVTQARVALEEQRRILADLWWGLIQTLKLPEHWKSIDAFEIPLKPFDESSRVRGRCEAKDLSIRSVEKARLEQSQAADELHRAESNARPDLALSGKLGSNGVVQSTTDNFGQRWSDALAFRNPLYSVSLQFTVPLDRFAERAELVQARANRERKDAMLASVESDERRQIDSLCRELDLVTRVLKDQKEIVQQLRERMVLEEDRYGRAAQTMVNVILAGADLSSAEFQLRSLEVRLRATAWNLLKITGVGDAVPGVTVQ